MNILVVDDSKAVHNFIKSSLVDYININFLSAYSGQDALESFNNSNGKLDIVLLDWEMPIMDGPSTIKAIRSINQEIPIIQITSKNKLEDIKFAMDLGANDYIMKPFTEDVLVEKISNFFELEK